MITNHLLKIVHAGTQFNIMNTYIEYSFLQFTSLTKNCLDYCLLELTTKILFL